VTASFILDFPLSFRAGPEKDLRRDGPGETLPNARRQRMFDPSCLIIAEFFPAHGAASRVGTSASSVIGKYLKKGKYFKKRLRLRP
jgi:hypothetical protein